MLLEGFLRFQNTKSGITPRVALGGVVCVPASEPPPRRPWMRRDRAFPGNWGRQTVADPCSFRSTTLTIRGGKNALILWSERVRYSTSTPRSLKRRSWTRGPSTAAAAHWLLSQRRASSVRIPILSRPLAVSRARPPRKLVLELARSLARTRNRLAWRHRHLIRSWLKPWRRTPLGRRLSAY
jgi:hypothetical protein